MNSKPDNDDEFARIEKALRALRPVEPSAFLESRVFAVFDDEKEKNPVDIVPLPVGGPGKIIHWFRPIAAAAAVAAVFLGAVWLFRISDERGPLAAESKPVTVKSQYQPVSAGNVFERATDEGVVYPDEGTEPMRRVRYQYHDTYEWRHPEDGSLIRLSVPQEEFLYLPVETD